MGNKRKNKTVALLCFIFFVQIAGLSNVSSIAEPLDALGEGNVEVHQNLPYNNLAPGLPPLNQKVQPDSKEAGCELNKEEERQTQNMHQKFVAREELSGDKADEIKNKKKERRVNEQKTDNEIIKNFENAPTEANSLIQNLMFVHVEETPELALKNEQKFSLTKEEKEHAGGGMNRKHDEKGFVTHNEQGNIRRAEIINNSKNEENAVQAILNNYTVFDLAKVFAEEYNKKDGDNYISGSDEDEKEREIKQKLLKVQGFEFTYETSKPSKQVKYYNNYNKNEQSRSSSSKVFMQAAKYIHNVEENNAEIKEPIGEEQQENVDQEEHFSMHRLYTVREIRQICKLPANKINETHYNENSHNRYENFSKEKKNDEKNTMGDTSEKISIAECLGINRNNQKNDHKSENKKNEKNDEGGLTYPPILLTFQNSDDFAVIGEHEMYIYAVSQTDDLRAAALLIRATKHDSAPYSMSNISQGHNEENLGHKNNSNLNSAKNDGNSDENKKKNEENLRYETKCTSSLEVAVHEKEMPFGKKKQTTRKQISATSGEVVKPTAHNDVKNDNIVTNVTNLRNRNKINNFTILRQSYHNSLNHRNNHNNDEDKLKAESEGGGGETEEGKIGEEEDEKDSRFLQTRFGSTRASNNASGIFFNPSRINSQSNLTTPRMVGVLALNYPCRNTRLTCQENMTAHRYGGMTGGHLRDQVGRYGHPAGGDSDEEEETADLDDENYHVSLNVLRSIAGTQPET